MLGQRPSPRHENASRVYIIAHAIHAPSDTWVVAVTELPPEVFHGNHTEHEEDQSRQAKQKHGDLERAPQVNSEFPQSRDPVEEPQRPQAQEHPHKLLLVTIVLKHGQQINHFKLQNKIKEKQSHCPLHTDASHRQGKQWEFRVMTMQNKK